MEERPKGTVTSLASVFPAQEAQKAAKRVDDAIAENQKQVHHLNQFIADNTNLINLVSRLPDELHHDVMVPFGKAAFFPGRLIHTNEFMVLLGEGYYTERTAKQTVEILKRRGKALDSQVESLKANIKDLRAEASFFDSTASEAAEGMVEIREDYAEEISSEGQSKPETNSKKFVVEDDEYDRIMSRLDELEKEELAAEGENQIDHEHSTVESNDESDDDENTSAVETDRESDEDEQTDAAERDSNGLEHNQTKSNFDNLASQSHLEIREPQDQSSVQNATVEALSNKYHHQLDITDKPNCTGLTVKPMLKDDMRKRKSSTQGKNSVPTEKALLLPEVEEVETVSASRNEVLLQATESQFDSSKAFTGSIVERSGNIQANTQHQTINSSQTSAQTSKPPGFDSSKAFMGSIVEHTYDVRPSPQQNVSSQSSNSQPSKPVSRFKMQRK